MVVKNRFHDIFPNTSCVMFSLINRTVACFIQRSHGGGEVSNSSARRTKVKGFKELV